MSEEQQLEWEQETGTTVLAAQRIVTAAVDAARAVSERAMREVQEVVGPHGSVTRLQAGGVRVTRNGVAVFQDGVQKTMIEADGDFFSGSDVTLPATTSFTVFANEQTYNNEEMGAGDLLIGDNSTGEGNVKYDASEGQLQFRGGTGIHAYMDTDGTIKFGNGEGTLDEDGLTLAQGALAAGTVDPSLINWVDVNNNTLARIQSTTSGGVQTFDYVGVRRSDSTDSLTQMRLFFSNLDQGVSSILQFYGTEIDTVFRLTMGAFIYIEAIYTASTKKLTLNANQDNLDVVIMGDTDANLVYVDASTDRVGIGTAGPGYKLDVNGDVNVFAGYSYYIDGVDIFSTIGNLIAADQQGWIETTFTWTRTGNHTFTVIGNQTSMYRKGTKIRYADGGATEYGVVLSSSYDAGPGTTTVTLITNTDYGMAAATITDTYISYIENPEGFPHWFTWAVTWTNLTVGNGTVVSKWRTAPHQMFYEISVTLGSTTTVGDVSFAPPVTSAMAGTRPPTGEIVMFDTGTANYYGMALQVSSTSFGVRVNKADATYTTNAVISSIIPMTWTTNDELNIKGSYRY